MKVALAYGEGDLVVDFPDSVTVVVEPEHHRALVDPIPALRRALAGPIGSPALSELVRRGQKVAISICDGTRPQPRREVLTALMEHLDGIVDPSDVVVLVATGTHRVNTKDELTEMLGIDLAGSLRVLNHDARDSSGLVDMGLLGEAVPVWLKREWVEADVRITTGLVEPHFFAGFSGGPKMVAPGLAGLETVLCLHDATRIGHPMARWGVTEGNPVHDDVRAIAAATGVTFALDVVVNRDKEIVAAFAGDLPSMHAAACAYVRRTAMRPLTTAFDVVVTTNSGFPLDQNLYQAVKGMSAAAQIVKPGGLIVCAAECRDGFPDHGSYRQLLKSESSPGALLESIEGASRTVADQWQVQIQAKIQVKARVAVHTDFLSDDDLREAHLEPAHDIEGLVGRAVSAAGPGATVCVLPQGPQTIPYLAA